MSDRSRAVRVAWGLAASASLLAFLFVVYLAVTRAGSGDSRPVGTADDIAALAERDDTNLLFILVDTVRADRMGVYGYERDTTPNLSRYAASGVLFGRHLAQSSWTKCSMASLWTGLYPTRNGVTRFDDVLPDVVELPAEILKKAGFNTVGLYRNGWVSPNFGFDQGFDVYTRPPSLPVPPGLVRENPTLNTVGTDEDTIKTAIEYLRVNGDERWFLYLHLMDVHEYTYDEESALFGGSYSDVYDNSIRRVDGLLEVLFRHLAESGLAEETIVVLTSDHGEAFRERGIEGHARAVYRETTEVPLVVGLPFRLDPGVVVGVRSRNVDLWPTLLDLLGLEGLDDVDGRSLVPDMVAAVRGEMLEAPDETGIAHLDMTWGRNGMDPQPTVAVVDGPWRYVKVTQRDGQGTYERLFDASVDPRELSDRAAADPEKLAQLREVAEGYLAEEPVWGETPTRQISEMELNQLRALGYAIP